MWQKLCALCLFLCFSFSCLSAEAISSEDMRIKENQQKIILIAQSLIESDRINELNLKAEREAWQKEKDAWQKEKGSWLIIESDMVKLKDSLEKQSESLRKEQAKSKALGYGCTALAIIAAIFGVVAIVK